MVFDTADTAHFLAAAGAPGAAMDEVRQGRAMTRRFARAVTINGNNTPVIRGCSQDKAPRHRRIIVEQRQGERPLPAIGERDRVLEVLVRHQGCDRTERLHVVDELRAPGIVGAE